MCIRSINPPSLWTVGPSLRPPVGTAEEAGGRQGSDEEPQEGYGLLLGE